MEFDLSVRPWSVGRTGCLDGRGERGCPDRKGGGMGVSWWKDEGEGGREVLMERGWVLVERWGP